MNDECSEEQVHRALSNILRSTVSIWFKNVKGHSYFYLYKSISIVGPWSKFSGDNVRKGCAIRFSKPERTLLGFQGNFWRYYPLELLINIKSVHMMINDFVIVMTYDNLQDTNCFSISCSQNCCSLLEQRDMFCMDPRYKILQWKGKKNKTCRVLLLNLNSEYKGNVCIYVLRLCFLGVGVIHVLYPFLFRIDQFHFEIGW